MSFNLFNSFPAEIHSLILEQCSPNDLTCLRLTCKYLYNIPSSKPRTRIDLVTEDIDPLCCLAVPKDWVSRNRHKEQCHSLCYDKVKARNDENGLKTPPMKKCRTAKYGWAEHCECFTRRSRLHYRLAGWIGGGLKYCGSCHRFTKRKSGHGGRCHHGRAKLRSIPCNFWTHRSRKGAFGHKVWKKWFTNRDMNKFEKRLSAENIVRKGKERYDMRILGSKDLDTRDCREAYRRYR